VSVTVTTQAELDAALAANEATIYISSPEGVWMRLTDTGSSRVVLRGSSSAELWGSSSAELWGSSRAELWGSSRAELWGSSSAELRGSSSAVLRGSSSAVLRESSRAVAGPYCAVHLHSAHAEVVGGVLIDLTGLDLSDPATWAEYHGVEKTERHLIVYKAVDDVLASGRGFAYPLGKTVTAPDWKPTAACGAGLHFGPSPRHAKDYFPDASRFLACAIPLDAAKGITDGGTAKIKAARCEVLYEVDLDGNRLPDPDAKEPSR
jgi:hypothetical protein